jgi:predicted phage terminase large subunit-like protein
MTYGPCSEKQKLFLNDTTTDIILLGGGAGGGKSYTCLTKNLDGIEDPHFRCTIFRRTQPELKRQGGLIDESKAIYKDFKGVYKSQSMTWEFKSGAKISFAAIGCDDDLGGWQGSQLVRALIDEAADKWTEKQVLFLLSRLRSAHCKVPAQMILTANPDINSFLKTWVDYCLDDEGVPLPGTEHRIRWMVALDNQVYWADTPEECYELHGAPRGMIYAKGLTAAEMEDYPVDKLFIPKSFRFIPTGVMDNPYLLPPRNTSYLPNLLAQPYVNQLRYLKGSWTAKEAGSGYFLREWIQYVDEPPAQVTNRVRSWDFAASEQSVSNKYPDATAGVKMSRDKFGIYYIEDVQRVFERTDKVLKTVIETAQRDGLSECSVTIPKDPGAAGTTANLFYARTLAENGVAVRSCVVSGHSGKLTRFKPFAAMAESGAVRIVNKNAPWVEPFLRELENFDGVTRTLKDDQVDATSDAFNTICKSVVLPTIMVPALQQSSVIPTINS